MRQYIDDLIHDYLMHPTNQNSNGDIIFGAALTGVSKGDDPLYEFMKKDIGHQYWTPTEAFTLAFPELDFKPQELRIISWVLPFTQKTKQSQYACEHFPSINWILGKLEGEPFNDGLREHLVASLKSKGIKAVAPCKMAEWGNFTSDQYGFASKWSERHAAYISGLGTFGLCDGLITEVGKAHRCGSIIVLSDIQVTERPYAHHHEYCKFFSNGSCQKCIERCPAGAVSREGHNKTLCRHYQNTMIKDHIKNQFDLDSTCCGLCQTDVPCESRIPF